MINSKRSEILVSLTAVFFLVIAVGLSAFEANYSSIAVTFFTASILIFTLVRARGGMISHLDLSFFVFLFIYSVSFPLSYFVRGGEIVDDDLVSKAYQLSVTGLAGFALGVAISAAFSSRVNWQSGVGKALHINNPSYYRNVGVLILLLGVFLSFIAIYTTVGFGAYLNAGYAGRALIKREAGPVELGLYVCIVGVAMVFLADTYKNVVLGEQRKFSILLMMLIVLFVAYVSFLGIRRPAFLLLISCFVIYTIFNKVGFTRVILTSLVVVFLFATFAQYRQLLSSVGLVETISFIGDNASLEWLDFSQSELGAPFKTLLDTLPSFERRELYYGGSYLSVAIYIFPSFITGGYQSLSMEYTINHFDPGFIAIGGNMGYFPITEAVDNFGIAGPFVVMCIFGFVLSHYNRKMYRSERNGEFRVLLFSLLIPWMAFCIRLDFSSFVKGFFYTQLIPIALAYLIYYRKVRKYR